MFARLFLKGAGLAVCLAFLACAPAWANQSEAREVARLNNCTPKKIEVVENRLGMASQTVYRIECNMPKLGAGGMPNTASAVLVLCERSLCDLVRVVPAENK